MLEKVLETDGDRLYNNMKVLMPLEGIFENV